MRRADGHVDLYFRKGFFRQGPLCSEDGTQELQAEVDGILARMAIAEAAIKPVAGTVVGALEKYNVSSEFTGLEASTQRDYQYKIDDLKIDCGPVRLSQVAYSWLKDMQDAWALRGHKACNDRMQILKNALKPAMRDGRIVGNPFEFIEKLSPATNREEPHPAWRDEEVSAAIEMAIERRQPGLARAIALGRWGGFRRGSICAIPLNARTTDLDDDGVSHLRLRWQTKKRGVICDKVEDARLTKLLERTPNRALSIAYNKYGTPWKERSLNQAVDRLLEHLAEAKAARAALDIHGLRHARGTELANAGASDAEIMAQLEHASDRAARIYRRQASRRHMADSGQRKIDEAAIRQKRKGA